MINHRREFPATVGGSSRPDGVANRLGGTKERSRINRRRPTSATKSRVNPKRTKTDAYNTRQHADAGEFRFGNSRAHGPM